jgi:CubicO group peptidase (beta-lactamase class C family)
MLSLAFALLVTAAPAPRADSTIARAVDSLATRAVARGLVPGLGVAVTLNGRTILDRGYGFVDVTAKIPAADNTLWYIASTSKSFTGFAVALLLAAYQRRLDTPITTLLPRVKWHPDARPDTLTLAHFLSHTHNLDDRALTQSAAFTGAIPEAQWPQLIVRAAPRKEQGLYYSNFGYNVAAMAIDGVRAEGWKAYLQHAVYQPAGLRETYTRVSGLDTNRIARPHELRSDGSYQSERFAKTDATMNAAGGHLATMHDLARWTIVQMDGGKIDGKQVFPANAVALSHKLIARHTVEASRHFAYFDREGWASGWDIGAYEGEPMVSRFGSYDSYRSHLSFLPGRRIGVVAVANGGIGQVTDLLAALAYDLQAGRPDARARADQRFAELEERLKTGIQRTASNDSARAARQKQSLGRPLADFTGRFAEPAFGEIQFTLADNRLTFRWGVLQGPVEIFDAEKRQMRIEIAGSGVVVTFDLPEKGPARSIQVQEVTYTRVP